MRERDAQAVLTFRINYVTNLMPFFLYRNLSSWFILHGMAAFFDFFFGTAGCFHFWHCGLFPFLALRVFSIFGTAGCFHFWHCGLFPFLALRVVSIYSMQLAVNCFVLQVLLYQIAALFL